MSAAVESTHRRSYFSPLLDTMARPGSGWGSHDPYGPRHSGAGYYSVMSQEQNGTRQHPQSQSQPQSQPQQQQSGGGRLPGPSSLFTSPPSTSQEQPHYPPQQHPASPSRAAGRPAYYGGEYATPSPVEPPHHALAPRSMARHSDPRLSPTQSSATSDRSEEGIRGAVGAHAYHPPSHDFHDHHSQGYSHQSFPPASQESVVATAANTMSKFSSHPRHMHPSARPPPLLDENRQTPAGSLMGKLVPQGYHPNGRAPRPTHSSSMTSTPGAVPTAVDSRPQHHSPSHPPPLLPPTSSPPQQQQHLRQRQHQAYPSSPPTSLFGNSNGISPASLQNQHQSSMSPRPDPRQMSINSLLTGTIDASPVEPRSAVSATGTPVTVAASIVSDGSSTTRSSGKAACKAPSMASSKASSKAPMTVSPHSPAPSLQTSEYSINVRQQPVAARSCGFGERDRRVIDPPPIVQLLISDDSLSREEVSRRIRHPFSVVHCSIWDETGNHDNSAMPEDYRQQRRLMGTLVASPFVGTDENGKEGCFFCFPDLSCRTPGSFRLKFQLVVINPHQMRPGVKSPIVATSMSEVFTVYNAKDFPGMQASTALTKRLKEQGCLISIKKGNEKSGGGGGGGGRDRDDSDDDDDSGPAGGGGGGGKRKKRKT